MVSQVRRIQNRLLVKASILFIELIMLVILQQFFPKKMETIKLNTPQTIQT